MRKAKVNLVIVLIVTAALLSGCWDSFQLEDITVYFGLALDVSKEDKELITITVSGPTVQAGAEKQIRVISSSGKTVADALNNLQARTDKLVTLGHLRIILIGRELAERGLGQRELDALGRDHQIRTSVHIAMVNGRAQDLLETHTEDHPYIALYLVKSLEASVIRSLVPWYTLRDFFQCWTVDGRDAMMPVIDIDSPTDPVISRVAVFNNENKLAGIIRKYEPFALLALKNNLKHGRFTFPLQEHDQRHITVDLSSVGRKMDIKIKNETIFIDVIVKLEGDVVEYTDETPDPSEPGGKRIATQKRIKEAEELAEKEIKRLCDKLIERLQKEYKADPVGFGRYVNAYHHEYFKYISWTETFPEVIINVKVEITLERVGVST